jgi:hypothetical protein
MDFYDLKDEEGTFLILNLNIQWQIPRALLYMNLQQHTDVPDGDHILAGTCCVNENMVVTMWKFQ